MTNNDKCVLAGCLLSLAAISEVRAQDTFKYPGCADVTRNDFTKVTVVDKLKDPSLDEPIRFAVAKDGAVYFAERNGVLKAAGADGSIRTLGKIQVNPTSDRLRISGNNEFGLVGLVLDPGFEYNHQLYVTYQPASPDVTNISRFTLANGVLDPGSEKILLSWPVQKNYCCHTGGGMQFDAKGDLWLSVGNDTRNPGHGNVIGYVDETNPDADDQGHAANTNDYRGKILRIHPTPDGKYTVPPGNLKEFYGSMWNASDLALVKPEIYTMGHRNPYTLAVDDVQGLLAWGDVGPDDQWETEELDIVERPGFMGWPYFAGAEGNAHYLYRLNKDPLAPKNASKNNTGVMNLPPARGATVGYRQSAAITGPIYRYTNNQTSPKKVPGHFDGKWFATDFDAGWVHVLSLDNSGTVVTGTASLLTGLIRPLQITIGPDGILYILEYATGYKFNPDGSTTPGNGSDGVTRISRLEYKGQPCLVPNSLKDRMSARSVAAATGFVRLGFNGAHTVEMRSGSRGFQLFSLRGERVWKYRISDASVKFVARVSVPSAVEAGLYLVRFDD